MPGCSTTSPYASTPEREEELLASRSTNAVFKPRAWPRHTMSALVLVVAAATAFAVYTAVQDRTYASYGVAGLAFLLLVVVWAVRASTSVTEMAVIRGQLEIIRDGRFEVVDLASPYTPLLVEGSPGQRSWKVLILRKDLDPFVIDSSIVDPHEFMDLLRAYGRA